MQVAVGGGLGLGLRACRSSGMAGVASGQVASATLGTLYLGWHLLSGRSRLPLAWSAFSFSRAMFNDILRVGAVSSIASFRRCLPILIFTGGLAGFGNATLAGYGIGARLEFMLIPIAFAVGSRRRADDRHGDRRGAGGACPPRGMDQRRGVGLRRWHNRNSASRSGRRSGSRSSPAIPQSPAKRQIISATPDRPTAFSVPA